MPGMGKDFAEADAEVMALFDKANAVLGFDLKKVCFEDPDGVINQTCRGADEVQHLPARHLCDELCGLSDAAEEARNAVCRRCGAVFGRVGRTLRGGRPRL